MLIYYFTNLYQYLEVQVVDIFLLETFRNMFSLQYVGLKITSTRISIIAGDHSHFQHFLVSAVIIEPFFGFFVLCLFLFSEFFSLLHFFPVSNRLFLLLASSRKAKEKLFWLVSCLKQIKL